MRRSIPKQIQLKIWKRDRWVCQYCGRPVFFGPTLKLLEKLSPSHGYYHPHGKASEMLLLFRWLWASIDHVKPISKGGEDTEDNYVTACWECNLKIGNKTKEEGKPGPGKRKKSIETVNWDGLSSIYTKLSERDDDWTRLLKKS